MTKSCDAGSKGVEGASARDCFLFFCQGAGRANPYPGPWPTQPPVPPGGNPAAPLGAGLDRQYSATYAAVEGEPFPIPAVKLSDIDPAFLRKAVYYPRHPARHVPAHV